MRFTDFDEVRNTSLSAKKDIYQLNAFQGRWVIRKSITENELIEAYHAAATIVELHGEKYLPIFERLHKEMQARTAKNQLLEVARNLSLSNTLSSSAFK